MLRVLPRLHLHRLSRDNLHGNSGGEMPAMFVDLEEDDENDKIHSHWSCFTVASLASSTTASLTNVRRSLYMPSSPSCLHFPARMHLPMVDILSSFNNLSHLLVTYNLSSIEVPAFCV
jgi:hypothetical protein